MKNSLVTKMGWSAVASLCNMIGRLAVQIMIARMLGPDGVGRLAYIVWLIEIANVFTCFGLPSSLTRYLAVLHGKKDTELALRYGQWVYVRYFALATIGMVFVGVLYYHSYQYTGAESTLPVMILLFFVSGLQTINRAELAGRQQFEKLSHLTVIATIALLVGIYIGGKTYGVTGVLYGYVGGALVPAICSLSMLRGFFAKVAMDSNLRKRVWRFSFNSWLAMIVSAVVWSRAEIFFIERYWNVHEVAMFTIGLTFVSMVQQAAALLSGSLLAHFSQLVGEDNHLLVGRHYEIATKLVAIVVIPVAFGGAAIMPVLLPMLFGARFSPAVPNAMVLTATAALAFSTIGSTLIYAKEKPGYIALSGFAGAIISVILGFIIISRFGAWGAVWVRLFLQGALLVAGLWYIDKFLRCQAPIGAIFRITVAATVCGFSAWIVIRLLPSPLCLFASISIGAVCYFFCLRLLKVVHANDIIPLEKAAQRIWRPLSRYICGTLQWLAQ